MVNNVLDMSKLETQQAKYYFDNFDILELIKANIEESEGLLSRKSVQVEITPPSFPCIAYCDHQRITQVIRNLLTNAIKFTPSNSKISFSIEENLFSGRRRSDTEKTKGLAVSITDQGIGIPANELRSVFNQFIQSSRTKDGSGGTGLGLAICKEIIMAHNGRISAANNPDGGAIFTFTLPTIPLADQNKEI
jgi:two-component system, LuxR family, sensor kinase FixL